MNGRALRGVVLWWAGADLRITLLAIPPVIPLLHRDLGLSESGIAALSNLPVLVLAASSIFGSLFASRLGARRALVAGLWTIALGGALRGWGPSIPMLFAMTVVMGAGIAIAQPALPALSRGWFPSRAAFATGIWANGLLCGEALSASLTIPFVLPLVGGGWEACLAAWSIPVVLTALACTLVRDDAATRAQPAERWFPDFRDPRIRRLGVYQSAASLAYFGANTFLPDYLHAVHRPALIAPCLAALNIGQIPASLIVGLIPLRVLGTRAVSLLVAGLLLAASAALLLGGAGAAIPASAVIGLFGAYVLTMTFALPAVLGAPGEVARISAGTFTLGYSIAFAATLLAGAAWDLTHVPASAFAPILVAAAIAAFVGPRLGARLQR